MNKICTICGSEFIDDSLDSRHDWCAKCEDEWNEIQKTNSEVVSDQET